MAFPAMNKLIKPSCSAREVSTHGQQIAEGAGLHRDSYDDVESTPQPVDLEQRQVGLYALAESQGREAERELEGPEDAPDGHVGRKVWLETLRRKEMCGDGLHLGVGGGEWGGGDGGGHGQAAFFVGRGEGGREGKERSPNPREWRITIDWDIQVRTGVQVTGGFVFTRLATLRYSLRKMGMTNMANTSCGQRKIWFNHMRHGVVADGVQLVWWYRVACVS